MDALQKAREELAQAEREAFMEGMRKDDGCRTTIYARIPDRGNIEVVVMLRPDHTWEFLS